MPSLILHNSCSVDIFILCPSFISSMYEIFEINVLKSLRHNVDGMLYLYMIYLKFSANTEDSQLRNVLINDVTVILLELITLKIYFVVISPF